MNALYRGHCLLGTRTKSVLFLSRQADQPSYDFQTLASDFNALGWETHMHLVKAKASRAHTYIFHVLREIRLLSRCSLVILDRYDPVVSLLDFDYAEQNNDSAWVQEEQKRFLHTEFPQSPTIVQLWHAFGAYKKFGYQSIGTREGHSRRVIDTFNIHRNYSWVVCSGPGCCDAYAEAFAYPRNRIVVYRRPEYFELVALRSQSPTSERPIEQQKDTTSISLLFAPTLRKGKESPHPFRTLYQHRTEVEDLLAAQGIAAQLQWAFHPLESNLPAPGNVNEALVNADVVVTDYSSIVFEAYALGKPVVFYVPDIDEYRISPGLNIDPVVSCPALCASTPAELVQVVLDCLRETVHLDQLNAFGENAFGQNVLQNEQGVPNFSARLLEAIEDAALHAAKGNRVT